VRTEPVTLNGLLSTLDELPDVVARLADIRDAAAELSEVHYAGACVLAQELDNALEALDGAPGALLYLAGVRHARGDHAAFERWDAGLAGRIRLGEFG
jgi:hypothetical protein